MPQQWNNFYERFAATAERFAGRTAVEMQRRDSVKSVTYGDLQKQAEAATKYLASRDIREGDKCAILADNDISWCAAYLGILRLGAIAVPFDTHYSPPQIAALLRDQATRKVSC
jgi:acyl-CoA synthetase (AMP-forming)/AMP-acid ligase II